MPENVARQLTSTARKSTVSLPESTAAMLEFLRCTLQERRGVKHTKSDAMMIAVETVLSILKDEAIIIARNIRYENIIAVKSLKFTYPKVCDAEIRKLAREYQVSRRALVHACISMFSKALIANDLRSLYRQVHPSDILKEERARLAQHVEPPKVHKSKAKMRKANRKKDQANMGYRSYLAEFEAYLDHFGGIDQMVDKELTIPIYTLPIKGMVGKKAELELPIPENTGRLFTARMWRRGRGLNLTIHAATNAICGLEVAVVQDAETNELREIDPPDLPVGSVWRLYDIYRNIDWPYVAKANTII